MRNVTILGALAFFVGCALPTVRQEDLDAWVGQPVTALEVHPIFNTMPVVKTITSDGTEIWNFVNGRNLTQCYGRGRGFAATVNYATYSQFMGCMSSFAACNNIFTIQDGVVENYAPVGTGGLRCYTTEVLQPGFSGPVNIH